MIITVFSRHMRRLSRLSNIKMCSTELHRVDCCRIEIFCILFWLLLWIFWYFCNVVLVLTSGGLRKVYWVAGSTKIQVCKSWWKQRSSKFYDREYTESKYEIQLRTLGKFLEWLERNFLKLAILPSVKWMEK